MREEFVVYRLCGGSRPAVSTPPSGGSSCCCGIIAFCCMPLQGDSQRARDSERRRDATTDYHHEPAASCYRNAISASSRPCESEP